MSLFKLSTAALLRAQKFGKTKEQQKCIDFFALGNNPKKGGCLSRVMSVSDYLGLVDAKANSIDFKARAIEKIGIDEEQIQEIPPICLTNFCFDDAYIVIGKVKNNFCVVSNKYSITWLFFSPTQMYVYTYIFDMISNNVWESVREFFYTDITCFRTMHKVVERIETKMRGCLGPKPVHTDYDVDTLCITVPGEDYAISMRNSPEAVTSIYAARSYVREKKYMK